MPKQTFYVNGMHCASCELLIERKLKDLHGVSDVSASLKNKTIDVDCIENFKLTPQKLNKLFSDTEYSFSDEEPKKSANSFWPVLIAAVVVGLLVISSKTGLLNIVRITPESSLPFVFTFGLVAGFSSCAALVGGIVLSLAEKWNKSFQSTQTFGSKITPHLMFNLGRILSFSLLGAVLGYFGEKIKLSGSFTTVLIIVVSVLMIVLALQMLGVKYFDQIKLPLPKSLSKKVSEDSFNGKLAPLMTGFLTFLLPCGFTLIAESVAILSQSAVKGSMIMTAFVLGTSLPLLLIGMFSVKMLNNKKITSAFSKVAAFVVIFFAFYNINMQLGLTSSVFAQRPQSLSSPIKVSNDIQVIKATYTNVQDIVPSTFNLTVGKPVIFEVDSYDDAFGCMSTIMVPGLYNYAQPLRRGSKIVMEFTPTKQGSYQITCAMGVPRGIINVK